MRAVVAVDDLWGIGREGKLLCHISADLKHFKELTLGKPVILGRKTLETFPGGKPLPGRENIILSRNPELKIEGAKIVPDADSAVEAGGEDAAVIGGAMVYEQLYDRCDEIHVTKIEGDFHADCFFPNLDVEPNWRIAESGPVQEENGVRFRYLTYKRLP